MGHRFETRPTTEAGPRGSSLIRDRRQRRRAGFPPGWGLRPGLPGRPWSAARKVGMEVASPPGCRARIGQEGRGSRLVGHEAVERRRRRGHFTERGGGETGRKARSWESWTGGRMRPQDPAAGARGGGGGGGEPAASCTHTQKPGPDRRTQERWMSAHTEEPPLLQGPELDLTQEGRIRGAGTQPPARPWLAALHVAGAGRAREARGPPDDTGGGSRERRAGALSNRAWTRKTRSWIQDGGAAQSPECGVSTAAPAQ